MGQPELIAAPAVQYCLFDYGALDVETRIVVQQRTDEIKGLMRRAAQDIIDIGQKLIEIKARLGHGQFGAWLAAEFEWNERTARRFMEVGEQFKTDNLSDLQIAPSALYLLAAPSTPEPARVEALELAAAGEPITHARAQEITARHKAPPMDDTDNDEEEDDEPEQPAISHQSPAPTPKPASPMAVHFSSDNPEWYTPADIINRVRRVLGSIDLDPASSAVANETVNAATFYTEADNGLAQDWRGNVYMNPPYGDEIGQWVERLCVGYEKMDVATAVALLPARTDTRWFSLLRDFAICFVRGRLKFSGSTNSAPFPSIVVYLGDDYERFTAAFGDIGDIWMRLDRKD